MRLDIYESDSEELLAKASEVAYVSVVDAFEYFMQHYRVPSKPLVLVGHSQGSQHLVSLLTNRRTIPENLHAVIAPGTFNGDMSQYPYVDVQNWSFEYVKSRLDVSTRFYSWNFVGKQYPLMVTINELWGSSLPPTMLGKYKTLTLDASTYADLITVAPLYGIQLPPPLNDLNAFYKFSPSFDTFELKLYANASYSNFVEFTSLYPPLQAFEFTDLHFTDLNLLDWTSFLDLP